MDLHVIASKIHTNFHAGTIADISESAQGLLCRITAELGNGLADVLLTADRFHICGIVVGVDSAKQAAWRRSDGERSKSEQGRGEKSLGEHLESLLGRSGVCFEDFGVVE